VVPVYPSILIASISLTVGISFYLYNSRDAGQHAHSSLLIAWLLIALTPVFLVFTFFPASNASAVIMGFSLGGAIAAFAFIWIYGSRQSIRLLTADRLQTELNGERERSRALQEEVQRLLAERSPIVLAEQEIHLYRIAKRKARRLAVVTGDIMNVRFADIWINSENTNMQMSRFFERTISATIRYHGARKDEKGAVLEDSIANELAGKMGKALSVAPATVLVTSSGELASSHNVRAILHVASVFGEPGAGYAPVSDIARCVERVLDESEQLDLHPPARTIILPLLGTGSGNAGLEPTCQRLLTAAINWLTSDRCSNISTVYFLAYRDSELRTCLKILSEVGTVIPQ
jgi:O-acetyl-ADP-ribose deacetylase (regulator of RNase III)